MKATPVQTILATDHPQSVMVFRALMLGDMICAGPAFASLRSALPEAHLTLVGLPWMRDVLKHLPGKFDSFVEFPGYPGLPEREVALKALPRFLQNLQSSQFDLAIQMHGSGGIVNPLVAAFGARHMAGYYQAGDFCPDAMRFIPYPQGVPEIWKHLMLMKHLGAVVESDELHFEVFDEDLRLLERLLDAHRVDVPYVCVHPGTRASWRCWPVADYAAVGDALVKEGYAVVLTGSPSEQALCEEIVERMKAPAVNLAGATSGIGVLAALLQRSSLLICGDTGVSHLGCAVDCRSVVIFMRSELEGWPPLDRQRHRVVCGINGVTAQRVVQEALHVLHGPLPVRPPKSSVRSRQKFPWGEQSMNGSPM